MSEGNGAAASDPGLQLIKEAFEDAQYLSIEAKDAAHMIQLGAHREQEIPDQVIMSIYGTLTEGKKAQIEWQYAGGPSRAGDQAVMNKPIKLGATGEYPEGKLTPADEGALQFAVGVCDGKVCLDFGTPVVWIGMAPADAHRLAENLMRHAKDAGYKAK